MSIPLHSKLRKRTSFLLHEDPEEMAIGGCRQRGMRQDTEDQDPNSEEGSPGL